MLITFTEYGMEDYNYWVLNDKKITKRLVRLIQDITRNPFDGLGKPEPLRNNLKGKWSRRLTIEHRIIYEVRQNEIIIYQCRYHYDKN